jgi:hypothetical protein
VFDKVLREMQEKVRTRHYIVTLHAEEEMEDEELSIFDVERAVLTGKIIERQRDTETHEWKYRMIGSAIDDRKIELITKISITGKWVFITVYAMDKL